jgi:hypothetical protein
MTAAAAKIVDEFKKLDPVDQRLVWNELARAAIPLNYGQLTDEELISIADRAFVLLDREEDDAKPR